MDQQELIEKIEKLKVKFDRFLKEIDFLKIKEEIKEIETRMMDQNFWANQQEAKAKSEKLKELKEQFKKIDRLRKEIEALKELEDILDDDKILDEAKESFLKIKKKFRRLRKEKQTNESGKYDHLKAIIQISAGAGGLDAKDWTEMLFRMYLRYLENKGLDFEILNQSKNQEAGINNVTFKVKGQGSFGILKKESGVHRLVRLSPFNADNLRQTSFASVEVIPEIEEETVEIKEEDLKIDTFRASGAGGQHVNTTDSAVRLIHLPSGLTVTCQNERSQLQNRETARKILAAKLTLQEEEKKKEQEKKLKGEFKKAEWGNQTRSYILHPYKMVKDHKRGIKSSKVEQVLNGDLEVLKSS
jgi:peptide chain release factor 2